jgi:hypothetical protein
MADNSLTIFDPGQLPAHIGSFFTEAGSNIQDRQTVPSLAYEGKIWSITIDGNRTKLMRRNSDGDEEPISTMRVVILDYAKRRGRQYYASNYDPNNVTQPVCWSDDGIAPDDTLPPPGTAVEPGKPVKQALRCDGCPMSVKGSKIVDGKAMVACAQHRMLAVVPAHKLDFEPLRLKIAITSDWDSQSPDAEAQGWRSFSKYTDFLKSRGVAHTAALVTKMKFDPNTSYPKLFFAPDRWLHKSELQLVAPLTKDERVQRLLAGTFTPNGVDGVEKVAAETPQPPVPTQPSPSLPAETPDETVEVRHMLDDDDDGEVVLPTLNPAPPVAAAAQTPTAEATPAASDNISPDVAALLEEWGD